jgi:hypothetical protein
MTRGPTHATGRFESTDDTETSMFEVLDASDDDDVLAVRVGIYTRDGFRELYEMLAEKSNEQGSVHLYEEAMGWTLGTYLSNLHGIVPDLRYGSTFDIERYAAVGDSVWAKALYYQWKAIAPVWPVSPDEMRYYEPGNRKHALSWVRNGNQ